jgi:hypothetical protein
VFPRQAGLLERAHFCPLRQQFIGRRKVCGTPFLTSAARRAGVSKSSRLFEDSSTRAQRRRAASQCWRSRKYSEHNMCTLMPVESDVVFPSIVSLWIRGSVLLRSSILPTPIILTSEPSKSTCWTIQPKDECHPFQDLRLLIDLEKALQGRTWNHCNNWPTISITVHRKPSKIETESLSLAGLRG